MVMSQGAEGSGETLLHRHRLTSRGFLFQKRPRESVHSLRAGVNPDVGHHEVVIGPFKNAVAIQSESVGEGSVRCRGKSRGLGVEAKHELWDDNVFRTHAFTLVEACDIVPGIATDLQAVVRLKFVGQSGDGVNDTRRAERESIGVITVRNT